MTCTYILDQPFPAVKRQLMVTGAIAALMAALAFSPASAQTTVSQAEQFEQAEILRTGDGLPVDLRGALEMHEALANEGYSKSLVRVAAIYEELGDPARAIEFYTRAVEAGDFFAELRLANGHATGSFGELSRPEEGFANLRLLSQDTDNHLADYYYARAHEKGFGTPVDLAQATEIYEQLTDDGHGMSAARLASLYADEDNDLGDLDTAIETYRLSAESGYDYALIGLARALVKAGRGEEALAAMNEAVAKGVSRAEARRAIWHYTGDFGDASDRDLGKAQLVALAEEGESFAARYALRLHERRSTRLNELDLDKTLAALQPQIEGGDRFATEAAARAYRELYWLIPGWKQKHAALVENYGDQMGIRYAVPEKLEALYEDGNHAKSRAAAYTYLDGIQDEGFVHGLVRLRSIEKRAFVYAVQEELKKLGYYSGPSNALLTASTVRAMLNFCKDEGAYDTCIHGPINYDSAFKISEAIYKHRMPGT